MSQEDQRECTVTFRTQKQKMNNMIGLWYLNKIIALSEKLQSRNSEKDNELF